MRNIYLFFCLITFNNQAFCQAVFYGERENDSDKFSLYFDKEGTVYPEHYIRDNALEKSNSSLYKWYKDNPQEFQTICLKYGFQVESLNDKNFESLQDSIIRRFISRVDIFKDSITSLTFLIHGFRKPFKENSTDYTSEEDYFDLENSLRKHNKQKFVFVEIYWDGYYDCCIGRNISTNKRIFQLFEDAQINAEKAGNTLRNVINKISLDKINIVTHSLGALVAVQSIFNYKQSQIETSSAKKISVCLIAPAIAGTDVFKFYYQRNTALDFKTNDNYRLAIAYNVNDFILKKQFKKLLINWGPGPYKYGNTTLGCNYDNEAYKLKEYFEKNYSNSYFELIDLSSAGSCHYLGNDCYSKGNTLEKVAKFLEN